MSTNISGSTEPKGSERSSLDDLCARCGCKRSYHHDKFGCNGCAIKMRGSDSIHAFVPAHAETAGEPEAHPHSGYRDADEAASMYPEPEAPEEPACRNCGQHAETWFDRSVCAEPCGSAHNRCSACGFPAEDCAHDAPQVPEPPRRPPYAVAYAIEGGPQYEIALPGDATVRAVDGALVITHDKPVLAMGQVRPMEGA